MKELKKSKKLTCWLYTSFVTDCIQRWGSSDKWTENSKTNSNGWDESISLTSVQTFAESVRNNEVPRLNWSVRLIHRVFFQGKNICPWTSTHPWILPKFPSHSLIYKWGVSSHTSLLSRRGLSGWGCRFLCWLLFGEGHPEATGMAGPPEGSSSSVHTYPATRSLPTASLLSGNTKEQRHSHESVCIIHSLIY